MQAAVKKSGFKEWMRKNGTGYAFLLPFLILFAVFVIVPVAVAMYYSLTNYNMIQPARFVGISNYSQLILDDDVFLISLKAGGTGLNLTGADMVIHFDPWWNTAAQEQATDRAYRIGQTKKVTVYKLIPKYHRREDNGAEGY